MRGEAAPALGELDLAEKGVMQLRTAAMRPALGGLLGILLIIFAFRYGVRGLYSLFILPLFLSSGAARSAGSLPFIADATATLLVLAGILLGAGIIFNFRNMAVRVPGFSSPVTTTRNVTWGGYVAAMIFLAIAIDVIIPATEPKSTVNASPSQYTHVSVTVAEDGSESYVVVTGDLTVDLSGWPSSEWSGVTFRTSNPSVLSLDSTPAPGDKPIARLTAHQTGVSRVEAASSDGRYTFQLRVDVGLPPT
jgi:hypothetical protein